MEMRVFPSKAGDRAVLTLIGALGTMAACMAGDIGYGAPQCSCMDTAGAQHAGTGDKMVAFKVKAMVGALALCALQVGAFAQDVKVGAVFPMSGPNATYGDLFSSGANLAAEHINADGKLKGKMSVLYEDSLDTPQRGVIGMNKLVSVDKVPYVLTGFTGVSKAVSTVGQRTKTVAVNAGGVGPDLAELGEYFWNVIPLVNYEVRALIP